jgi:hypothetical protein
MAQPTQPLYVWAEDDVILPTAGRPNKKKPSDSLILTGWDQSQKPAADEFNDILNNISDWLRYVKDEKVDEFLKKASNLSDLSNTTTARTNLDVYGKSETYNKTEVYNKTETLSTVEINGKQINTGAGLQGGGDLSSNRTISLATPSTVGNGSSNSATNSGSPTHTHALTLTTTNISILTGTVISGGTIPLPSGYTEAQCKWTASINTVTNDGDPNVVTIQCTMAGRVVTVAMDGNSGTGQVANYMIIGVK